MYAYIHFFVRTRRGRKKHGGQYDGANGHTMRQKCYCCSCRERRQRNVECLYRPQSTEDGVTVTQFDLGASAPEKAPYHLLPRQAWKFEESLEPYKTSEVHRSCHHFGDTVTATYEVPAIGHIMRKSAVAEAQKRNQWAVQLERILGGRKRFGLTQYINLISVPGGLGDVWVLKHYPEATYLPITSKMYSKSASGRVVKTRESRKKSAPFSNVWEQPLEYVGCDDDKDYMEIDLGVSPVSIVAISTKGRYPQGTHVCPGEAKMYCNCRGPKVQYLVESGSKKFLTPVQAKSHIGQSFTTDYELLGRGHGGRTWINLGRFKGNSDPINENIQYINHGGDTVSNIRYLRVRPLTTHRKNCRKALSVGVYGIPLAKKSNQSLEPPAGGAQSSKAEGSMVTYQIETSRDDKAHHHYYMDNGTHNSDRWSDKYRSLRTEAAVQKRLYQKEVKEGKRNYQERVFASRNN